MPPVLAAGQIAVMAVVNRTPDSFHDHGATFALDRAVAAAIEAVDAGADWVDVGGLAFSPRTPLISAAEEADRVVPVVEGLLAARPDAVVSVDTWRSEVARRAIEAGARVVNDVSGLRDPAMADLAAATGATLVIAHSRAMPHEELERPRYGDVVGEVRSFLAARAEEALAHGVAPDRIVLDPGHDLNKNTQDTLAITRRLPEIVDLGYPTLAAVSHKDFLAESTGLDRDALLAASLTAAVYCLAKGARVIRMHDVAPSVAAARLVEILEGTRPPRGPLRHNM